MWVAAATAAAQMSQSLTYDAYDDAVDVGTRYTNAQIEAAIIAGEFLFTPNQGKTKVEVDLNTFTGYTPDKGKPFSKNRVIRVLDGIANDFKKYLIYITVVRLIITRTDGICCGMSTLLISKLWKALMLCKTSIRQRM